jgi:hypothetical protein
MALRDDIPALLKHIEKNSETLIHNAQLFDIYEGDLVKYVLLDFAKQLSPQNFEQVKHRIAPINVLRRMVDKLSKIYMNPPVRWLSIENEKDHELLEWYLDELEMNVNFGLSNEFFNLFKNSAIEFYIKDRCPAIRSVPSDRFLPYSSDAVDPTEPTHIIKFMGSMNYSIDGQHKCDTVYYLYTDTEFLPIDKEGRIIQDILNANNNPEGVNIFGKMPFIYINRSRHNIIPPIDTDTLRMTRLIPVLLSDLNFAVMYQTFSIVYGIDLDDENISMSPNAFWRFKSDPTTGQKPEIGVITPKVDIQQVVAFIVTQLAFWLQSKNIRPGAVGSVDPENFASGVSKIVDDMDTYEDRQKQVDYFEKAEAEFFDFILNYAHPTCLKENLIDEKRTFADGQSVKVEFPEQRPMIKRSEILAEVKTELQLGLTTRKDALMRLNPDESEADITELMAEIDQENVVNTPPLHAPETPVKEVTSEEG